MPYGIVIIGNKEINYFHFPHRNSFLLSPRYQRNPIRKTGRGENGVIRPARLSGNSARRHRPQDHRHFIGHVIRTPTRKGMRSSHGQTTNVLLQLLCRHRFAEKIALHFVATERPQYRQLFRRFHTFCDNSKAEAMPQGGDG